MSIVKVMHKAMKRFGVVYPASETKYSVEIVPGKSISIYENDNLKNSFAVGDMAEYGSYNLSYFGPILSISDKAVVVSENKYGSPGKSKKHVMDLYKFCWRNVDFDAEAKSKENSDTMMYI